MNPQVLRYRLRVRFAPGRRERPGHRNAQHIFHAQGVHRNRCNHRRINASAQPHKHFLEAAFAHIVARPGYQGAIRISNLLVRQLMDFALSRCGIEDDQVFFKCFRLSRHLAIRGKRNARAVENQAVVAPHLIDVNDRPFVRQRNRPQHLEAQCALVEGIRRTREVQQYRTSLPHNFADRVALVHGLGPKVLVVPHVFADRDSQLFAV